MMRRGAVRYASVAFVGVAVAVIDMAGCDHFRPSSNCENDHIGCVGGGGHGGGGGGGGGNITPLDCVPSTHADPVEDTCGVFVSSSLAQGNDDNPGTKTEPVSSLEKAISLARDNMTGRVYACAEELEGPVEVPAGVTIYGGLDCKSGWSWVGETTKTTLTAAEGAIPLTMRGIPGTVRLEDLRVVARSIDQDDLAKQGMSSIAAVASSTNVELARCAFEAGDAAPGAAGVADSTIAKRGEDGNPGAEACTDDPVPGGQQKINDCGTPLDESDDSAGGSGGDGLASSGNPGVAGRTGNAINGGAGQPMMTTPCRNGIVGDNGTNGMPGSGATGLGMLSTAGYTGVAGGDGTRGTTAQGGGGGGGARGTVTTVTSRTCPLDLDHNMSHGGASGGSGGSGGCGGPAGKGGRPGGASIAIVNIEAALSFDEVTLTVGNGGKGGDGSPGKAGGVGGAGGPGGLLPAGQVGLLAGCDGGTGGTGGSGGPGGGGLGGHSLGIAYRGTAPSTEGATFSMTGAAGLGGVAGVAGNTTVDGAAGIKADVLELP